MTAVLRDGAVAGAIAAVASGAPSTAYALAVGRDPLEGSRAAGSLLLPSEHRARRLLPAALVVHLALSLGWAIVLSAVLREGATPVRGALAGLCVAGLDLGLVGRRLRRIRALDPVPQVADHLVYGAVVGAVLRQRVRARG